MTTLLDGTYDISHEIKQTNYFLKTLFIKEPSCSFEGGETTEY